ncbi:MAG TPA: hypothetical protein VEA69_25485 [Tepidisphaeraceae bacterium]|nr:hypothetical protein [Tepidisphaeraceae bacterium]
MFPDPSSVSRFFRGVYQRFGLTIRGIREATGVLWPRMQLTRLWGGQSSWRPDTAEEFVPFVANLTGTSTTEVWDHLWRRRTGHPVLSQLEACVFWPPSEKSMQELGRRAIQALSSGATWVHVGGELPLWMVPDDSRRRAVRSLLAALDVGDHAAATHWEGYCAKLFDHLFPADADALRTIPGTVLIAQAGLAGLMAGRPPWDALDDWDLGDFIDGVARAMPERGGKFGILADPGGDPGSSPLGTLQDVDSLWIIGNRLLIRRDRGSAVWASCERTGNPLDDVFLDGQIALVDGLKPLARFRLPERFE